MKVVVLGAGPAGLSASLALSRSGHEVVLVERDELVPTDSVAEAFAARRSVSQFLLPHGFLARSSKVLREGAPDVYDALLDAGAVEIDMCTRMAPADRDPDLIGLAARRPLIEWALTRALESEPNVEVRERAQADSIVGRSGVVEGVIASGERIRADLVIDATGRGSRIPAWIDDVGGRHLEERSTLCGTMGYARYYRLLEGVEIPIVAPVTATGDTGYMSFGIFWEDNGIFAAVLTTPAWDRDLRS
ncbi:MAG: FAD-dependent oxidoreductase, partial [Actinomycetota bacterium]